MYCRLSYRVPFSETDAMGIVHHSNHPRYFERGRVEFLRLLGLGYLEMTKRGVHFPLTELQCKFRKPLRFDECLLIETKIKAITKTRLTFSYKIFLHDKLENSTMSPEGLPGAALVEASTEHCCLSDAGKPIIIEDNVYQQLQKLCLMEHA